MSRRTSAEGQTLIARAPLRISFAGGGTDLPAYFEQYGGMVVSMTIDKYVYVHCSPNGSSGARHAQITSANYHTFYRHDSGTPMGWDGELALPKAVLSTFGVQRDVALFVASEVPPGTGLGSSSAAAVALVKAVSAYLNRSFTPRQIAELACHIELDKLKAPVGKQDQFASAFGGLNVISFARDGVRVEPLCTPSGVLERLEGRLMLFFTGTSRDSGAILKSQQGASSRGDPDTLDRLHRIKAAAAVCKTCLETGDLDGVGRLLDEGWRQKRRVTTGISNPRIDELYEVALAKGALGGKIAGAGGGGFLLLYCHEGHQDEVTSALENLGLLRMDFHLEKHGVALTSVEWKREK